MEINPQHVNMHTHIHLRRLIKRHRFCINSSDTQPMFSNNTSTMGIFNIIANSVMAVGRPIASQLTVSC